MAKVNTLKITQIKSAIGYKKKAKATLKALGLRKMHQTIEQLTLLYLGNDNRVNFLCKG